MESVDTVYEEGVTRGGRRNTGSEDGELFSAKTSIKSAIITWTRRL